MTTSFYPDGVPPIMPDPDSPWGYLPAQPVAEFTGKPGKDGEDGKQGPIGPPGTPGTPGRDGTDGAPGLPGLPGLDGTNGAAGRDGLDGTNGTDGAPGRGVESAFVYEGDLYVSYTDATFDNVGSVVGPPGPQGEQGPIGPEGPPGSGGGGGGGSSFPPGYAQFCWGQISASNEREIYTANGSMLLWDASDVITSGSITATTNFELVVDAVAGASYRFSADFDGKLIHADTPSTSMTDWTLHLAIQEQGLGLESEILRVRGAPGTSRRSGNGTYVYRMFGQAGTTRPLRFAIYAKNPSGQIAPAIIRLTPGQYGYNFITVERVH